MQKRESRLWLFVIVLLALYGWITVLLSSWELQSTIDENIYRVSGLHYLKTADFSMNFEHPPFSKWWGALTPYVLGKVDSVFLFRVNHGLLFLFVGLFIANIIWRSVSPVGAVIWSALYFLCPNTKAMASLHVNDFDVAGFSVLSVACLYAFYSKIKRPHLWIFLSGFFLSLAMNSKFTGLFLIPFIFLSFFGFSQSKKKLKEHSILFFSAIVSGFLLSYLFHPSEVLWFGKGIDAQRLHDRVATHPSSLLGEIRSQGFWYYYILCFISKTHVLVLLIVPWSLYWALKKFKNIFLIIFLPMCFLLLYLSSLNVQTGLRYFLPGILLLYFLLALGLSYIRVKMGSRGAWFLLVFISSLWITDAMTLSKQSYLSYFNVLAPKPTTRNFTDANNDWGQDIPERIKSKLPYTLYHVNSLGFEELSKKHPDSRIYVYAGANDLIGFWSLRAKGLNPLKPVKIIGAYEIFELSVSQALALAKLPGRP